VCPGASLAAPEHPLARSRKQLQAIKRDLPVVIGES
jgi:hypothetical protein